ncbi:chromosome condensation protein CrcB [Halobacteriales archaeon QH_8_68_33]|nr:MAG: chromosome condensation protein CrcB [Halobacteriales archaeon QH_8_68_33]
MTARPIRFRSPFDALVAIGGFAGSNLRYFVDLLVGGLAATLLVNVVGSFALGVVVYGALRLGRLAPGTRAVLATGFLSSLTTYSTFAVQTVQSSPTVLVGNVLANYALGFAGVLAGRTLVAAVDRRRNR